MVAIHKLIECEDTIIIINEGHSFQNHVDALNAINNAKDDMHAHFVFIWLRTNCMLVQVANDLIPPEISEQTAANILFIGKAVRALKVGVETHSKKMLPGFAAMSEFKNGKSFNASLFEHCTEKLKEQVESYPGQLTGFLNISQQDLDKSWWQGFQIATVHNCNEDGAFF